MSTFRSFAKSAAGRLAWPVASPMLTRNIGGYRGIILMFHYVGEPVLPGAADFLFIAPDVYARILDFVAERLHPLPPAEFFARLTAGTLPPRATLLTFDDGTRDNVTAALPPLIERDLTACFFVSPGLMAAGRGVPSLDLALLVRHAAPGSYQIDLSGYLEQPADPLQFTLSDMASRAAAFRWQLLPVLMAAPSRRHPDLLAELGAALHAPADIENPYPLATWSELAQLVEAGNTVGSHTMWHSTIAADGPEVFAADLAVSIAEVERYFPASPRVFCFPYGRPQDATPDAEPILDQLNVDYALLAQESVTIGGAENRYALRRIAVNYGVASLKLALARAAYQSRMAAKS